MASEFSRKVVVVTGSSSGIGLAQARLFLKQQAVVIGIDKEPSQIVDADFIEITGDVSKWTVFEKLATLLQNSFQKVDIVCNTAGVLDDYRPVLDTSVEQWSEILRTDLTSQFLMTKAVLPLMVQQGHGVFVNMASIAGLVAGGGGVAYTAAKHAVIGLTKQVDADYASKGIRANCIAPGAIDTPMNAKDFVGEGEMAKWVADQTPAKRWAKPEEVAELSLFLASKKADYIHGTVIPIDGGWLEK